VSTTAEQRTFAESIATAADRALARHETVWRADAPCDDREQALDEALALAGWPLLAEDPELLGFAGPAAVELGRRLAPLNVIDELLGGPLLAGELVRYGGSGTAVALAADTIICVSAEGEAPVSYGDATGVWRAARVTEQQRLSGEAASRRIAVWVAATVGYSAGIGDYALALTTDYARQRRAFGTTLSGLSPVQQMLAGAATSVRGLALLAGSEPGVAALAFAGPAVCEVTASCQQVTGAIGFTLEYPLQRAHRRARALMLWNESVLDALAPNGQTGRAAA
jgi:hypothetical protein